MLPPGSPRPDGAENDHLDDLIDGLEYTTEGALLIAGNDWWDGATYERKGTNRFLYRSPAGRYFLVLLSCNRGEAPWSIQPIGMPGAVLEWRELKERRVEASAAFPDLNLEPA